MLRNDEEVFQICGDAPDPMGSHRIGQEISADLTKTALGHPKIRYRDRIIEADVYGIDGSLMIHLICPKCSTPDTVHALKISSDQKQISYDPSDGRLSIEPFSCTWEAPDGVGLCKWRVAIDDNVAKDV